MNVKELKAVLAHIEEDRQVYVLHFDGTAQLAAKVISMPHINLPHSMRGISIPDDVIILSAQEGMGMADERGGEAGV